MEIVGFSLFLILGRQIESRIFLLRGDDHSLGGDCWADRIKSRCRTSDQGLVPRNAGLLEVCSDNDDLEKGTLR
jgi:hypothetical protein